MRNCCASEVVSLFDSVTSIRGYYQIYATIKCRYCGKEHYTTGLSESELNEIKKINGRSGTYNIR